MQLAGAMKKQFYFITSKLLCWSFQTTCDMGSESASLSSLSHTETWSDRLIGKLPAHPDGLCHASFQMIKKIVKF